VKGREQLVGSCDQCESTFHYYLIHNGFNDSYYAYCNRCGLTAILDLYSPSFAKLGIKGVPQGLISQEFQPHLGPCECGGQFTIEAAPRCPRCDKGLSAAKAASYIEKYAPGTKKGWRWQGNWKGIYCIVIENRVINNFA